MHPFTLDQWLDVITLMLFVGVGVCIGRIRIPPKEESVDPSWLEGQILWPSDSTEPISDKPGSISDIPGDVLGGQEPSEQITNLTN
jgi:hypothetical protein